MNKQMENSDFSEIVAQIEQETSGAPSSDNLPDDTEMFDAASVYGKQYDKRDYLYSKLLANYIEAYDKKSQHNKVYKAIFFGVILFIFIGLIVTSVVILFLIARKSTTSVADVALVVSGIAGIISAIIALPKIIAEHLFPTNEDENMIDMVKSMQQNDSSIRSSQHDEDS